MDSLPWRNSEEFLGVGAGEGLAAVRGYQSGVKGMLAGMPAFSREIEMVCGLSVRFSAPALFYVGHAGCVFLLRRRARGARPTMKG